VQQIDPSLIMTSKELLEADKTFRTQFEESRLIRGWKIDKESALDQFQTSSDQSQ
jgi:hypothetical protein